MNSVHWDIPLKLAKLKAHCSLCLYQTNLAACLLLWCGDRRTIGFICYWSFVLVKFCAWPMEPECFVIKRQRLNDGSSFEILWTVVLAFPLRILSFFIQWCSLLFPYMWLRFYVHNFLATNLRFSWLGNMYVVVLTEEMDFHMASEINSLAWRLDINSLSIPGFSTTAVSSGRVMWSPSYASVSKALKSASLLSTIVTKKLPSDSSLTRLFKVIQQLKKNVV